MGFPNVELCRYDYLQCRSIRLYGGLQFVDAGDFARPFQSLDAFECQGFHSELVGEVRKRKQVTL